MIEFFGHKMNFVNENGDPEHSINDVPPLHLYVFEPTPKISTYLFALAAGDYAICQEKERDERFPPFRLLMRNNLKSPLTVEEV